MADKAMDSECSGFGVEFDPGDSDCQGCKEGYPAEYEACKELFEAKQAAAIPDPVVAEEDVSLDKEAKVAESELDDGFDDESDELGVPIIPEEEDIEIPASMGNVASELPTEPKVESTKVAAPKKFRRIETFANLIREGESWIPSELANAVDAAADKTYKPGVTCVVVTQWLKLLFLIGIVEKLDGGFYRIKPEFLSRV